MTTISYPKLSEHSIFLDNKRARYYQMQQDQEHAIADTKATKNKPVAHFYGGNGFAVGVYTPLLASLSKEFDMVSLSMRGSWYDKPNASKLTREQDADLLIKFIEETQSAPVIGIGHSQGATSTALACAKRPDLFSAIYLLESVTFTRKQVKLYNLLPRWFLKRHEPFKSTIVKQSVWNSVDDYYHFLRKKNSFKRLSDEHLRVYVENSLEQTETGLKLIFPPEQELANYFGVPFIDDALMIINNTQVPYKLIIGKPSIFISQDVRNEWQKFVPEDRVIICGDYGHLLPVEAPELCSELIIKDFNQLD